ncbi:MAG: class II aldolase/adducin family protein [Cyanobium sp.]
MLAEELCAVMVRLHQRGWCEGSGGNFSCVLQRDPLLLLMAPSGVDKGSVVPEQLLLVDGEGMVVQGQGKASAETLLHLEIVRRTKAGAVLHTHSQAATLLSALEAPAVSDDAAREGVDVDAGWDGNGEVGHVEHQGLEMLKGLRGNHTHETRVRVPVLANDQNLRHLSERAAPHLQTAPHGLLIAGHGLYAWGADLSEALRHTEIHEFLLEQNWRLRLLTAVRHSGPQGDCRR